MNRKELVYCKIFNQKKFNDINQINKGKLKCFKLMKGWIYLKCINYEMKYIFLIFNCLHNYYKKRLSALFFEFNLFKKKFFIKLTNYDFLYYLNFKLNKNIE